MQVRTISYVHDPEAAQLWFEAYIDLVKDAILKRQENLERTSHTFDMGGEDHADGCVLSQFNESPGAFRGDAKDDGVQDGKRKVACD